MITLLLVALGGAIGACGRVWLSEAVARWLGEGFPWGTLVVNASGALAIGLLAARFLAGDGVAEPWREAWAGLVVGVLGSYTTVSAFSLQTLLLLRAGQAGRAALNLFASFGLCLASAFAGHAAGLRLFGG